MNVNADIYTFNRDSTRTLISVYAMRMAAVFTLSVSTVGLRTSASPRWVSDLGYLAALVLPSSRRTPRDPTHVSRLGSAAQPDDSLPSPSRQQGT